MASVWVTRRLVPTAAGSGIPQDLAVLHHADDDLRKRMLSLHVGLLKPVLTVIALLCGASVGREGPTVQIGAAVANFVGRHNSTRVRRSLIDRKSTRLNSSHKCATLMPSYV